MISRMYPSVAQLKAMTEADNGTRPIVMCEFAHAMGNSLGNLDEYWDLIRSNDRLIGGYIWDWIDQGLLKKADDGTEFLAYGGDYGDEPNSSNFCINGVVASDRTLKPGSLQCKYINQPDLASQYSLQIFFTHKEAPDWIGEDKVVAYNEFIYPATEPTEDDANLDFTVTEEDGSHKITSGKDVFFVDKTTGLLSMWSRGEREIMRERNLNRYFRRSQVRQRHLSLERAGTQYGEMSVDASFWFSNYCPKRLCQN